MPETLPLGLLSIGLACLAFWLYWKLRVKFSRRGNVQRDNIRIVTITGPSGAGKTTIVGELLKRHPKWKMVISLTSRGPRESDLPGEYECDVIKESFFWRDRKGEFIWMVSDHGNMYGMLLADIDEALDSEHPSLMQILSESVGQLRSYASGKVLSFFISPPNEEELRRRFAKRGDSSEQIERRTADCKKWEEEAMSSDIPYEFVRNDGTVEEAVEQVEAIIRAHI